MKNVNFKVSLLAIYATNLFSTGECSLLAWYLHVGGQSIKG